MRIYENGIYRDMTAEEIAAWEEMKEQQALSEPTIEERLEAAEAAILELAEVVANG